MKQFISINDVGDIDKAIADMIQIKTNPYQNKHLGLDKTLSLIFFNQSLRTRLSTDIAAKNLGLNTSVLNYLNDSWSIEFEDGAVMDGKQTEHIKESAAVLSQYCDLIAVRSFAKLHDKNYDTKEPILNAFKRYATVPIINMESSLEHPMQALTDALTLWEHRQLHQKKPKVVLTWAPHPKALPHAVANSFIKMMQLQPQHYDFVVANPQQYHLDPNVVKGVTVMTDQNKALDNADFVYTKNWSSYFDYGNICSVEDNWTITAEKMALTNNAKFMHCLPVRRNVVVSDAVLDSEQSIVIKQAKNRIYAAQWVIQQLLQCLN